MVVTVQITRGSDNKKQHSVGALRIRILFWAPLLYGYNEDPEGINLVIIY